MKCPFRQSHTGLCVLLMFLGLVPASYCSQQSRVCCSKRVDPIMKGSAACLM